VDKPEISYKVAETGTDTRNKTSDGGLKNFARLPEIAPQVCQVLSSVEIRRAGWNKILTFLRIKMFSRITCISEIMNLENMIQHIKLLI
jgi:hypothetical protein